MLRSEGGEASRGDAFGSGCKCRRQLAADGSGGTKNLGWTTPTRGHGERARREACRTHNGTKRKMGRAICTNDGRIRMASAERRLGREPESFDTTFTGPVLTRFAQPKTGPQLQALDAAFHEQPLGLSRKISAPSCWQLPSFPSLTQFTRSREGSTSNTSLWYRRIETLYNPSRRYQLLDLFDAQQLHNTLRVSWTRAPGPHIIPTTTFTPTFPRFAWAQRCKDKLPNPTTQNSILPESCAEPGLELPLIIVLMPECMQRHRFCRPGPQMLSLGCSINIRQWRIQQYNQYAMQSIGTKNFSNGDNGIGPEPEEALVGKLVLGFGLELEFGLELVDEKHFTWQSTTSYHLTTEVDIPLKFFETPASGLTDRPHPVQQSIGIGLWPVFIIH
ncbi:uncharacterized protein BDR25DRAFT_355161 [Lindgomyces ingoldianus]|uniref:Uncharacterized protein n=1 Tax=Lindgomyces ingoldianus TaxID=673940 RepID=A0ACB6QX89_9PLEO|nr:uncharacterized protein BDR25DRAFT_355161 [Lindgomyces ingoldianus]KAF2470692.1 hypothetical protein BDR25DRAFT_355161 [Lindgomyces ingoldianus]